MRIIERIEIAYFRSFPESTIIKDCRDLNVFSGANDSGKSNILRALNLFFSETKTDFYQMIDFEKDFSKERENVVTKDTVKGKKFFRISILFNKKGLGISSTVLPDSFWVEKVWDKEGSMTSRKTKNGKRQLIYDDGASKRQTKVETATTMFLKKIDFAYVPAIRDKSFFDYLKKEYQDSLGRKISRLTNIATDDKRTIEEWLNILTVGDLTEQLDKKIDQESKALMKKFKEYTHEIKESAFSIPNLKLDFSQVLEIATEQNIYLPFRGDGVQAKFIPQIMTEITKNKKTPIVIWGFEEPENSLEYRNAQQFAELLLSESLKEKQVFVTSHAFNFIALQGENVSQYRVYKGEKNETNITSLNVEQSSIFEKSDRDLLSEELGVFELNNELRSVYSLKINEINLFKEKKSEYERLLSSRPDKIFICEDSKPNIVSLWERFLVDLDIQDVKVMSSEGSTQNIVELGILHQKKLDPEYNPSVFRQIDRDGLTDGQMKALEEKLFRQFKRDIKKYEYSFLPVNEIENFAVIQKEDIFNGDFWKVNQKKIEDKFMSTVEGSSKKFSKLFDTETEKREWLLFRDKGGGFSSVYKGMRDFAQKDGNRFFPGKDICKEIDNFSGITFLTHLAPETYSEDLKEYLSSIKNFFEES